MNNNLTKEIFNQAIRDAKSICLLGHISPDGDCVGSVMGAYNYICALLGEEHVTVQPYLEPINQKFAYIPNAAVIESMKDSRVYDLAIVLDCASVDRLGKFQKYYDEAQKKILIDHHHTNEGFGDYALVRGDASSASEVLYTLMEEAYIDAKTAMCIYTGLIHDTGVFRHNSTHASTMEIAGACMAKGIPFGQIIEESFFAMTFDQKKVLGYILNSMESAFDGRLVYAWIDFAQRRQMHAETMDMDGMIDNMRTTTGALAAVYLYETVDGRVKASLRSNSDAVDVSRIATVYGGGGHKRAAGCFMSKDFNQNISEIIAAVGEQLKEAGIIE